MANIIDIIFRGRDEVSATVAQIQRNVLKFTGGIGGVASAISGLGVAGIAASLAGVVVRTRQAVAEMDNIATQAQKIGVSVETYQAMAFAARQAGISMDLLGNSVITASGFIRQAAQGVGKLVPVLAELDRMGKTVALVDPDDPGKLRDLGESYTDLVDAIGSVEDPITRNRLAVAAFGNLGARSVLAVAKEFKALQATAREMGLVIDRDTIAEADKLNDRLQLLTDVINARLNVALSRLAPILVDVAGGMADATVAVVDFFDAAKGGAGAEVASGISDVIGAQIDVLRAVGSGSRDAVSGSLKAISGSFAAMAAEIRDTPEPPAWMMAGEAEDIMSASQIQSLADAFGNLADAVGGLSDAEIPLWLEQLLFVGGAAAAGGALGGPLGAVAFGAAAAGTETFRALGAATGEMEQNFTDATAAMGFSADALARMDAEAKASADALAKLGEATLVSDLEKARLALDQQASVLRAGSEGARLQATALANLQNGIVDLTQKSQELGEEQKRAFFDAARQGPAALRKEIEELRATSPEMAAALTDVMRNYGLELDAATKKVKELGAATRRETADALLAVQRFQAEAAVAITRAAAEAPTATLSDIVSAQVQAAGVQLQNDLRALEAGLEAKRPKGEDATPEALADFAAVEARALEARRAREEQFAAEVEGIVTGAAERRKEIEREALLALQTDEERILQERIFAIEDFAERAAALVREGALSPTDAAKAVELEWQRLREAEEGWLSAFDVDMRQTAINAFEEFGNQTQTLLSDFITNSDNAGEAAKRFGANVAAALSRIAFQAAFNKIAKAGAELLDKQFPGVFTKGEQTAPESATAKIAEAAAQKQATAATTQETAATVHERAAAKSLQAAERYAAAVDRQAALPAGEAPAGAPAGVPSQPPAPLPGEPPAAPGATTGGEVFTAAGDKMLDAGASMIEASTGFGGWVRSLLDVAATIASAGVRKLGGLLGGGEGGFGGADTGPGGAPIPPTTAAGQQATAPVQAQQVTINSLLTPIAVATQPSIKSAVTPIALMLLGRFDNAKSVTIGAVPFWMNFGGTEQQTIENVILYLNFASGGGGGASAKEGAITTRTGLVLVHPQEAIIPIEKLRTYIRDEHEGALASLSLRAPAFGALPPIRFGTPPALPELALAFEAPELPALGVEVGPVPEVPPVEVALGPLPPVPSMLVAYDEPPALGPLRLEFGDLPELAAQEPQEPARRAIPAPAGLPPLAVGFEPLPALQRLALAYGERPEADPVEFGPLPAAPVPGLDPLRVEVGEVPEVALGFGRMPVPPEVAMGVEFGPLPEAPEAAIGFAPLPALPHLSVSYADPPELPAVELRLAPLPRLAVGLVGGLARLIGVPGAPGAPGGSGGAGGPGGGGGSLAISRDGWPSVGSPEEARRGIGGFYAVSLDALRGMASLATGGITTREGIVQVHPREAIVPLDSMKASGDVNLNTTLNIQQGGGPDAQAQDRNRGRRGNEGMMDSLNAALEAWVRNEQRPGGCLEGTRRR